MRIQSLRVTNFKNLRDFEIEFDDRELFAVLVGSNGSGKSNILEALVVIFRDLILGDRPSFGYQVRYLCRGYAIEVRTDVRTQITVDGRRITLLEFRNNKDRYLPAHVFGYYSGFTDRFERLFRRPQDQFKRQLINSTRDDRLPLRPLFFARPEHSQFVLLSFFLDEDHDVANFLKNYLRIGGFASATFILKKPQWVKQPRDRFWGATGAVRELLDDLFEHALSPLREGDLWHLFIPDLQGLQQVFRSYHSVAEFFKALESTYLAELIDEVRIEVSVESIKEPITFASLSEGEQQLLTVFGLLRFTREDESLFLLDEPDTHLNPAWSLVYLDLLQSLTSRLDTSQIIMATHDPVTMSGLTRAQVRILTAQDGAIDARMPGEDPKGMGIAGLLTSELFGLSSTLDRGTLALLDEKRSLAVKLELTRRERRRLEELSLLLDRIDFAASVRDPMYQLFVEAMSKAKLARAAPPTVLTLRQIEDQKRLAAEIVETLLSEQTT